jgi:hypothetical protein
MKVAQYCSQIQSIPGHMVLASASNPMVHIENGKAVMEEWRDVAIAQVQEAKQQESLEVTQMNMEDKQS